MNRRSKIHFILSNLDVIGTRISDRRLLNLLIQLENFMLTNSTSYISYPPSRIQPQMVISGYNRNMIRVVEDVFNLLDTNIVVLKNEHTDIGGQSNEEAGMHKISLSFGVNNSNPLSKGAQRQYVRIEQGFLSLPRKLRDR